jgi:excisionase family DNA binding protein
LTAATETRHSKPGEAENPTPDHRRPVPNHTERTIIMKAYLTIEEVARSLRVSVPTVRWLRQKGRFAPGIKIGRRVVWDEEALAAWVEANREAAA